MKPPRVPAKWIRGEVDREAVRQGCYFDEEAGERACRFVETYCKQSIGKWAGQPLELLDWQRDFLIRLFGWKRSNGLRRYRRVYLEIAKKNGKSTLFAALILYLLIADGESTPEIHLNAAGKKQAGIVFNESARMIRSSPELASMLEVIGGDTQNPNDKRIVWEEGSGVILVNSSVADSKDGANPSAVGFDELHRQPDRKLWDVYEFAGAAREQPLKFSMTTAGESESGVWFEQREYADQVNAGVILDVEFLGVVYRALPGDDIDDPETWRKANPSLGVTFTEEEFKADLERSKTNPLTLALFMRLRLNIVTRSSAKYADPAKWKACDKPLTHLEDLRGKRCYAGADLSTTEDLTGVVFLFGDDSSGYDVHCRAYLPEEDIVDLERRHRAPYRVWAEQGYITLTPGSSIDYEFIRRDINEIARANDLYKGLFDRHNATQLVGQLIESDGLKFEFIQQGYISLNPPTKELLRLISRGLLRHGNNPVLTWCLTNAVADMGPAGNIKLSKDKSTNKIDLAAALVNAVAAKMSDTGSQSSVYNERGMIFL